MSRRHSRQTFESDSEDEFASASEGEFESMDEQDSDQHEPDTNSVQTPSATNQPLPTLNAQAPMAPACPPPASAPAPAPITTAAPNVEKPPPPQSPSAAVTDHLARLSRLSASSSPSSPLVHSGFDDTTAAPSARSSSSSTEAQRFVQDPSLDHPSSAVQPPTKSINSTAVSSQAPPPPMISQQQQPLHSTASPSLTADRSNQEYMDRLFGPPPFEGQQYQIPPSSRSAQSNTTTLPTARPATPGRNSVPQNHAEPQAPPRSNGSRFGDQPYVKQQLPSSFHQPPQSDAQRQQHQHQQQQKGWGSLSSWLNTAVSTVSEVIENPNVVVSKAHTISKGIRTVASEQIDRVYESLDPEYEYERDRAQKTGLPRPQQGQQGSQDRTAGDLPSRYSQESAHQDNHVAPPPSSSLPPGTTSKPERDVRSLSLFSSSPKPASSSSSSLLPPLSMAQDTPMDAAGKDGWGDDGWGDQWDDSDSAPGSTTNQHNQAKPALDRQPSMSPRQPTPTPSSSVHQQLPPRSPSSQGQRRNQLDVPSPATYQEAILGRSGGGSSQGSQAQRRSSSEIRPAEALFSTLDFASNALGNAVLGVHRKVTQANPKQQHLGSHSGGSGRTSPHPHAAATSLSSPEAIHGSGGGLGSAPSSQRVSGGERKGGVRLNPVDIVGGNVVSTGLGALESLGKKAVDVIADVRRAGNQGGRGGSFEYPDDMATFKIPPRMEMKIMFDDTNGPTHLTALSSISSSAQARFTDIASARLELMEMAELDQVEKMLSPQHLKDCIEETQVDLLASHKDFRAIVALLENMGVQGTTILRHLRNSTRKLGTLPQDTVVAFEQEWFNHQSRASEKDFFAKVPIKRFFETRLMNVYFDGLKAIVQFSEKSCEQVLRLAENLQIRVAEKNGQPGATVGTNKQEADRPVSSEVADSHKLSPIDCAKVFRAFMGKLLSEARFVAWTYGQCMDAILQAAKGFTTPLQGLDWDELLAGVIKLKRQLLETDHVVATEFICKGVGSVVDVFKYELCLDVVQGRLQPTFLPKTATPKPMAVTPSSTAVGAAGASTARTSLAKPTPSSSSSNPSTPPVQPATAMKSGVPLSATLPRKSVPMAKTPSASSTLQHPSSPSPSTSPALQASSAATGTASKPMTPVGMPRRPSTPASPIHQLPPPPRTRTPVNSGGSQSPAMARPSLPSTSTNSFGAATTTTMTTTSSGNNLPRAKTPLGSMSPEMARPPLPPPTNTGSTGSPSWALRSKTSSTSLSASQTMTTTTTSTITAGTRSVTSSVASSPSPSPVTSPKPGSRTLPTTATTGSTARKMSLGARRVPMAGDHSTEPVPATPPLSAAAASSLGTRALSPTPPPPVSSLSSSPSPSLLTRGSIHAASSQQQQQQQQQSPASKGKVVGTPIARPPPPKKVPLSVQKQLEDDDFFSMLDKK